MRTLILMLILTTLASIVQLGNGYPKATDRAERWQLRLDTGDLRFYRAADTGAGYWILVYEVTNETDKDHRWIPQFDLVTDKGEIIPDGNDVPRSVKLAVLAIFGDPLMQSQSDASGPLLQGEENAIRSVAIWKAGREDIRAYFKLQGYATIDLSLRNCIAELTGPLVIDTTLQIGFCGMTGWVDAAGLEAMNAAFVLKMLFSFTLQPGEYHTNVIMMVLAGRACVIYPGAFIDLGVPDVIESAFPGRTLVLNEEKKYLCRQLHCIDAA